MKVIAYYVTAHGYGHGVRSCDVIRALKSLNPERPIHIISDLGERFFRNRLGPILGKQDVIRQAGFDLGMVQQDAIRTDVAQTLERLLELCSVGDRLSREESRYLRDNEVAAVVADIPAIPIDAAARAGIPAIAIANFSWDWIYGPYRERDERWANVIGYFRDGYAKADLLLRLPFSGDMSSFRNIEDLPLLASAGNPQRQELAERFGADASRPWVLLSFTSLNWERGALDRLSRLVEYEFFALHPFEASGARIHCIGPGEHAFQDVLASVDVVVSKPGFGIVSDCIANRKPLIYAERTDFSEYPILLDGMNRYLRNLHIPSERLYAGELAKPLAEIGSRPEPAEVLGGGGATIAARRIERYLEAR
ncbi:MAG: hypothetical protein PHE55_07865 [Methylococcaceae bacterium]|nr:hypothetical protein [Methylococcaceae bacterium]